MGQYKIGDKVKVINYGSIMWRNDNGKITEIDILPEIVGKVGIVCTASETQGRPSYALDGIGGKHAWYDEEQLEKVCD